MSSHSKTNPPKGAQKKTTKARPKLGTSLAEGISTFTVGDDIHSATFSHDLMALCDQQEESSPLGFAGMHSHTLLGDGRGDVDEPYHPATMYSQLSGDDEEIQLPGGLPYAMQVYLDADSTVSERTFRLVAQETEERKERKGKDKSKGKKKHGK
ncbi:hypothetical protein GQ53DRAFT_866162 [Thozetella sp. PMI_491]|nr:hypothetical protein GQ53DRAFT_866162 [Thozetella sp. PMI_491]